MLNTIISRTAYRQLKKNKAKSIQLLMGMGLTYIAALALVSNGIPVSADTTDVGLSSAAVVKLTSSTSIGTSAVNSTLGTVIQPLDTTISSSDDGSLVVPDFGGASADSSLSSSAITDSSITSSASDSSSDESQDQDQTQAQAQAQAPSNSLTAPDFSTSSSDSSTGSVSGSLSAESQGPSSSLTSPDFSSSSSNAAPNSSDSTTVSSASASPSGSSHSKTNASPLPITGDTTNRAMSYAGYALLVGVGGLKAYTARKKRE